MTNADKYLKDNVSVEELAKDITKFIADGYPDSFIFPKSIENYFKAEVQPTLTEDERVILRNIKGADFEKIGRDKIGGLYILVRINIPTAEKWTISFYDHLFQFIKERRRIQYRGVAEK